MKFLHLMLKPIVIFIFACILRVNAQQCIYDNKLIVANGTHVVNQNSGPDICTQSIALAVENDKAIVLIFSNVTINCFTNNLKIVDASEQGLDYCQTRRGENTFYFVSTRSTYVSLYAIGTVHYNYVVLFTNKPASDTIPTFIPFIPTTTQRVTRPPVTTQRTTQPPTIAPTTASVIEQSCGVSAIKPIEYAAKIVGGIEANANSWPWQVLISDGFYLCAASLLNDNWILTAAHCADMSPSRLQAILGEHNLNKEEGTEVKRRISKIIKHPFYNTSRNEYLWDYDIALMKFDRPVSFSNTISPICLPAGQVPEIGDVGIIIGWGDTKSIADYGKDSILKQTPITINPLTVCYDKLSDRQLCAGDFTPLHDTCQGDSGGPFFIKGKGGAYYVAGITSASFDDCEGHGIYTNVGAFEQWIYSILNSN